MIPGDGCLLLHDDSGELENEDFRPQALYHLITSFAMNLMKVALNEIDKLSR